MSDQNVNNVDKLRNLRQIAYITTDLEQARSVMNEQYGIAKWLETDSGEYIMADARMMHVRVLQAYVDDFQIEVIQPISGAVELFKNVLPADGSFALRFHHVCLFLKSRAELDELWRQTKAEGVDIPFSGEFGDNLAFFYRDETATLGHYLEYAYVSQDVIGLIPRN